MGIDIKLDYKYTMTSDSTNYILNEVCVVKEGDNAGTTYMKPVAFCSSIDQVLKQWFDKKIKSLDLNTWQELSDAIKGVREELAEIKHELTM